MCYLNLIAIVFLSKPALRALHDYDRQKKASLDPVFNPRQAGVENAEFWIEYMQQHDKH